MSMKVSRDVEAFPQDDRLPLPDGDLSTKFKYILIEYEYKYCPQSRSHPEYSISGPVAAGRASTKLTKHDTDDSVEASIWKQTAAVWHQKPLKQLVELSSSWANRRTILAAQKYRDKRDSRA